MIVNALNIAIRDKNEFRFENGCDFFPWSALIDFPWLVYRELAPILLELVVAPLPHHRQLTGLYLCFAWNAWNILYLAVVHAQDREVGFHSRRWHDFLVNPA